MIHELFSNNVCVQWLQTIIRSGQNYWSKTCSIPGKSDNGHKRFPRHITLPYKIPNLKSCRWSSLACCWCGPLWSSSSLGFWPPRHIMHLSGKRLLLFHPILRFAIFINSYLPWNNASIVIVILISIFATVQTVFSAELAEDGVLEIQIDLSHVMGGTTVWVGWAGFRMIISLVSVLVSFITGCPQMKGILGLK